MGDGVGLRSLGVGDLSHEGSVGTGSNSGDDGSSFCWVGSPQCSAACMVATLLSGPVTGIPCFVAVFLLFCGQWVYPWTGRDPRTPHEIGSHRLLVPPVDFLLLSSHYEPSCVEAPFHGRGRDYQARFIF